MRRLSLLLILPAAFAAWAGEPAANEEAMIAVCRNELSKRFFEGKAHDEAFISKQSIERQAGRVAVRLELASGEGRSIAGICIFRDGKLFDIK